MVECITQKGQEYQDSYPAGQVNPTQPFLSYFLLHRASSDTARFWDLSNNLTWAAVSLYY